MRGLVLEELEFEVPPQSKVKVFFKRKVWITNVKVTSPIIFGYGFLEFIIGEPFPRPFFPIQCDSISLTNKDMETSANVKIETVRPPNLSVKDFDIQFKRGAMSKEAEER